MRTHQVIFSPTDKHVAEIEKWLMQEEMQTGGGFYCNWSIIKSSFDKNELAIILLHNKAVGFATWRLTTDKTAKIEIAEIMPSHRKRGFSKKLTTELFIFLRSKGICVVDLQCAPPTSEPIWRRLGFLGFPEPFLNGHFTGDKLYSILTENLQTSSIRLSSETIEMWNDDLPTQNKPTYIWDLAFIAGTRKLSKPIIHPAHRDWRLRWKINGKTIKDDKIKYFNPEIDFGNFIIIDELPLNSVPNSN